nr:SPASM domain-containing protein [Candidatus Shapirobacteria bacterium]
IQSNGDIPLCAVDYEGKVVGGNIMTDKILDAYYSKSVDKIRKMHQSGNAGKFAMCANCRFSERGMYWWM